MLELLTLLALAAPQNPGDVVINEFAYDDTGTDDEEFVELYNRTLLPIDISNWTLSGEDASAPGLVFTIPAGTTLNPGQFWVMGSPLTANVNQVLVNPSTSTSINLFQNDEEALILKDGSGQVIDRVDYETYGSIWNPIGREGQGLAGGHQLSGATPTSYQRYTDGLDTNNNGFDFRVMPVTPGLTNNVASAVPYIGLYDGQAVDTVLAEFPGTFVAGKVIDPTQLIGANPSIIPASPQGGNAAIFYDPTGGGDMCPLYTAPIADVTLECYAYISTATTGAATDGETWSIGVRGSCDAFGQHVLVDPRFAVITTVGSWKPGLTGICWVYQRTNQYNTMWLLDCNDGGNDYTVLATVPIVAGQNDGWQRLKIRAIGDRVEGDFGGTFGQNDGLHFSARTTTTRAGGVYVGYREHLVTNPQWRPVTLDFITVAPGTGQIRFTGQGAPNTLGTPTIDVSSHPFIGNGNFAYTGAGFLPNNSAALVIGFTLFPNPINLSLFGAQNGSFFYVNSIASATLPTNANGNATFSLGIPSQVTLIGAPLEGQWFQLDFGLGNTLPISNTRACGITIGN